MNLKKRVATLLIPIMLLGAPFLTYAKTENTIANKLPWDKVIEKNEKFNVNLEMDFGDTLPIGKTDVFFLSGHDFDFDPSQYDDIRITTQSGITVIKDKNIIVYAEIDKYLNNYMRVEITNTGANDVKISIPINGTSYSNNMYITIDSAGEYVTSGKYFLSERDPSEMIIYPTAENPTLISKNNNVLSKIILSEATIDVIKEMTDEDRIVRLTLNHNGYKFIEQNILMTGKRGLGGFEKEVPINIIDNNTIEIELPKIDIDTGARGDLIINNLQIEPVSIGIYEQGDLIITISGNSLNTTDILVAKAITTENPDNSTGGNNDTNGGNSGGSNGNNSSNKDDTIPTIIETEVDDEPLNELLYAINQFKKAIPSNERIIPTNLSINHWSYDSIILATTKGLIDQDENGNVNLGQPVSRANMVQILGRLLKIETLDTIYSDVNIDSEYVGYLNKLSELGIIQGMGDNLFNPDDTLTREQAVTILVRVIEAFKGNDVDILNSTMLFQDNDISPWAEESIIKAYKLGIIKGVGENMFNPKGELNLEQLLVMIERMVNIL